jgi:hypothetical protein
MVSVMAITHQFCGSTGGHFLVARDGPQDALIRKIERAHCDCKRGLIDQLLTLRTERELSTERAAVRYESFLPNWTLRQKLHN